MKRLLILILILMSFVGFLDVLLLNLYINDWINLPHWFVWSSLRMAYSLVFLPLTMLGCVVALIDYLMTRIPGEPD